MKNTCPHSTGRVDIATQAGTRTTYGGDRATMHPDGSLSVGHALYAAGFWLFAEDKCALCNRSISIAPRRRSEAV